MSTEVNINLMERAAEMLDLYEGKIIAELIEQDLERDDLNALYDHVCRAEALTSQQEFNNHDIY